MASGCPTTRGSWSDFVGSWALLRHGTATKTTETRSLARRQHDRASRVAAKESLQYPPVRFTGLQARAVARGFGRYVQRSGLQIWACAVMPDHLHLVFANWAVNAERTVIQLKGAATEQLEHEGIHPLAEWRSASGKVPKCFVRGHWRVFLPPVGVRRAIRYVEGNPLKDGKKRQKWSFVVPYL